MAWSERGPATLGPRRTGVGVQRPTGEAATLVLVHGADEFEIEWGHGNILVYDISMMSP
jgi:hypothetical protein